MSGNESVRGFTLIELVITVAIVSLLATIAVPMAEMAVKRSHEQDLRTALRQIRTAIDAYKKAADEGHIERSLTQSGYPESLVALVEGVTDAMDTNGKKIYFLRRIPRDPLNADAEIPPEDSWGLRSYASDPDDPKDGDDVFDVYSMSDGTGINGIPYREW